MSGVLQPRTATGPGQIPGHVVLIGHPEWCPEGLPAELGRAAREFDAVGTGAEALQLAGDSRPDVLLVPEEMPDMSGADLLAELATRGFEGSVVMVLGEDGVERGAEALAAGAVDFLVSPFCADQAVATLGLVARSRRLSAENRELHHRLHGLRSGGAMLGCSPPARRLSGVLARVAESSATVLIEGRAGTGKTLAAHVIHASSRRSDKVFLSEYSDAVTIERLEAELAGNPGATLLLEDVEKLAPEVQSRLVRYIKERNGSSGPDDVRILATTSAHLPELVARGRFREDLYYRLNVFPIVVPSLQERRDDVAILADHFLAIASRESRSPARGFTTAAMILLETHPWPGNVAQLQDAVFRAHALAKDAPIDRQHLLGPTTGLNIEPTPVIAAAPSEHADEDEEVREEDIMPLEAEEKRLLARALRATKGNVRRAAQLLRIGRATLYRKIQVYKLKLN